jgi:hypothetical protein
MRFFSNNCHKLLLVTLSLGLLFPLALSGQTKKKPVKKNPPKTAAAEPTATPTETPTVPTDEPTKKNTRAAEPVKARDPNPHLLVGAQYSYSFDRPGFTYSHIIIEHDDSGKGRIWMTRDGETEALDDPIDLTSRTMANLKKAFDALNFLNSVESYQYPTRDYSNMGNVAITMKKDGVSRTAKFNWSENSNAKALMDEYRRISNEYTWKLEMQSARENQPLLTPGLVETFASYIDRNEISDPGHMLPLLTQLSLDERLPLLARNRMKKIVVKLVKDSK